MNVVLPMLPSRRSKGAARQIPALVGMVCDIYRNTHDGCYSVRHGGSRKVLHAIVRGTISDKELPDALVVAYSPKRGFKLSDAKRAEARAPQHCKPSSQERFAG